MKNSFLESLPKYLSLLTLITIIFINPIAFADRPLFRLTIETVAYPANNPLTPELDSAVSKAASDFEKLGYTKDVNALQLAYKNKDIAWTKAEEFLNKIVDGKINVYNIKNDAPGIQVSDKTSLELAQIKSFGKLSKLALSEEKGKVIDRMLLKKEFGDSDEITVRVIDFVYANKNNKIPTNYITVVLSAEKPYQKWHITDFYIHRMNVKS